MDTPPADSSELAFEALDALLDEALELAEPARAEFLARLSGEVREQLEALLRMSELDAFAALETVVAQTLADPEPGVPGSVEAAGEWRLLREIGAGGMGQVFYAERSVGGERTQQGYRQQGAVKLLWSHRVSM